MKRPTINVALRRRRVIVRLFSCSRLVKNNSKTIGEYLCIQSLGQIEFLPRVRTSFFTSPSERFRRRPFSFFFFPPVSCRCRTSLSPFRRNLLRAFSPNKSAVRAVASFCTPKRKDIVVPVNLFFGIDPRGSANFCPIQFGGNFDMVLAV